MTKQEQKTLQQVDQKVDDLILRFDRFIANLKWIIGGVMVPLVAALILALSKQG